MLIASPLCGVAPSMVYAGAKTGGGYTNSFLGVIGLLGALGVGGFLGVPEVATGGGTPVGSVGVFS